MKPWSIICAVLVLFILVVAAQNMHTTVTGVYILFSTSKSLAGFTLIVAVAGMLLGWGLAQLWQYFRINSLDVREDADA